MTTVAPSHGHTFMAYAIEHALPRLARNELSECNISGSISDWHAKHLRKAIASCSSLVGLHLSGDTNLSTAGMLEVAKGLVASGAQEFTLDFVDEGSDLVVSATRHETWHPTSSLTRSTVPWAPPHNAAVKRTAKAQYALAFNMLLSSGVDEGPTLAALTHCARLLDVATLAQQAHTYSARQRVCFTKRL